jgi:filamentous hemagglutinin
MSGSECFVDPRKLSDYLLNPAHDAGKSKAKFFLEIAGFSKDNLDEFAAALRKHFQDNLKTPANLTEYGRKLEVIGPMQCTNGIYRVLSVWIAGPVPRLITAYKC